MCIVPKGEIDQRIMNLQSVLTTLDVEGAFFMQNVDIYYFSGTIQTSVLFVPAEGSPILMVQKGYARAEAESALTRVVPYKGRKEMLHILRDFRIKNLETVGLELDVLPTNIYLWLAKELPRCRWIDISGHIRRIRMIKSAYEIEQVRKAATVLHKGFTEIGGIIREGVTELEVDGHLAMIARREGHMGILRMRGWNQEMTYAHVLSGESGATISFLNSPHGGMGNTPAMAQGAGFRQIRRNEPIGIDYGIGINGYIGDQFRTYVIGNLPPLLEKAHDCSVAIHRLFEKEAKPGVLASTLYHLATGRATRDGFGDFFMGHEEGQVKFIGHGIGLEIDEYPVLSPSAEEKLKEGMVIAVEPKFIFPGKGVVGLEDDYLVTATGVERLTLTGQDLLRIDNSE
jgi:Xaa-Pro aminopeptidase